MKPKIMHQEWWEALGKPDLSLIQKELSKKSFCPLAPVIFKCLEYPISHTKVMIMGSSPYNYNSNGSPVSNGLAFGIKEKDHPCLKVIRDSMSIDLHELFIEEFFDNTLQEWHKKGIMLLNASLTIPLKGSPMDHLKMWKPLIKKIIFVLNKQPYMTFVFMGKMAQEYVIMANNRHTIIKVCHPLATFMEWKKKMSYDNIPFHANFLAQMDWSKIKIDWLRDTKESPTFLNH